MVNSILLISSYRAEGIKSSDWFGELPNLSDYETVILDTTDISKWCIKRTKHYQGHEYIIEAPNDIDKKLKANMKQIKDKLLEMLEFNVSIYALFCPEIRIFTEVDTYSLGRPIKGHNTFIMTNDWCPIVTETIQETGKKIIVEDKAYEKYFEDFNSWDYYFDSNSLGIGELEHFYHAKWKVIPNLNAIATNKVRKPISLAFQPSFHRWVNDRGAWHSLSTKMGGRLVILPVAHPNRIETHIEFLIAQCKHFEEIPPPSWTGNIIVPGESALKLKITQQQQLLEENKTKMAELQAELQGVQRYKGLLYETGPNLQAICKSVFGQLGAKIKPSVVTDEFIIDVDGKEALIEVKGNTKSISKSDLAQLITDLGEHLTKTGEDIHGILVGNAWRLLPLEERDTKDKLVFPKDVISIANNRGIGLVSTTNLFSAYCRALEEPKQKREILDKIINSKGLAFF